MIKTTELMLGNLVELNGIYYKVYKISENHISMSNDTINCSYIDYPAKDINPIPLTEGVLKRLKVHCYGFRYVHEFQISMRNLDITPLLSPRYTTHDGVEVWEGDLVYYTIINSNINPQQTIVSKSNMDKIGYIFFSTQQACQSYIDSQTRKPIFTTEDGVDVFEGDLFVSVMTSGYYKNGEKASPFTYICYKNHIKIDDFSNFSNTPLAQAYLNKVWAEKEYQDLINASRK